ncbi:MAG: hypothetical protein J5633_10375 [Oscillospiraceae bacterium]|nr:hypothetical protein [Oscillospiraceae bacterium]
MEIILKILAPILFAVVIWAIVKARSDKAENKLVEEGKIIQRESNFNEKAEIFSLTLSDTASVTEGIKLLPYHTMPTVSMQADPERQKFFFSSKAWKAQLMQTKYLDGNAVYHFNFTNWTTYHGAIPDGQSMNILLTSIERMFLSIDPNTQVQTVTLKTKEKTNAF